LGVNNDLPPLNDSSNNLSKDISSGGGGDQPSYIPSPTFLDNLLDLNFRKVSCGSNHTILLEENGNLVGFGSNEVG
jgi:alpha-tubulin suppressor-like RCC1 family protein